jgi:hypothetical protein
MTKHSRIKTCPTCGYAHPDRGSEDAWLKEKRIYMRKYMAERRARAKKKADKDKLNE